MDYSYNQSQKQLQIQKLSQTQIQALKMLEMNSTDLRREILKAAAENPALEIIKKGKDDVSSAATNYTDFPDFSSGRPANSQALQAALENREDNTESLQQHLMHQLNSTRLSPDEYELSQKLIYNLDKNGFYGSMLAPSALIDKKRPLQTKQMLEKCIQRIQKMDPVGVCCKNWEESLFVQAKYAGDASKLVLFILDGHLDFLNPPEPEKVIKKIRSYIEEWHSKKFASRLEVETAELTKASAAEAISYIQHLNPRPASDFSWDSSPVQLEQPDIVLTVTKEPGKISESDFQNGRIAAGADAAFHFQVKYASGVLPELRISPFALEKTAIEAAKAFLNSLQFRQTTIVLQGCAIVSRQLDFFEKGPGNIKPLTRIQVAQMLGIHQSTVSRMSAKKSSKYIQTEFGLFPASYFFSSGVSVQTSEADNKKISSEAVKAKIAQIVSENNSNPLSDSKLTELLNQSGIKIARRTVAKYRAQLGLENSYRR